jgi:hypothetical protein
MDQNPAVQSASNALIIYDKVTVKNAYWKKKTTILEMCLSEHLLKTTQNIMKRVFAQGLSQISPSTFSLFNCFLYHYI